jgi:hypothetical protein
MSKRKRRNRINSLKRPDGVLCESKEEIKDEVNCFYERLYTTQEVLNIGAVLPHVQPKVDESMNERFCWPFGGEEVVFGMGPSKAPWSDGFNAGSYQRHWQLIKEDVTAAVLKFLNGDHMPEMINSTVIVLIPKVKNPQDISQYRPISLCNVIY